MNEAERQTMFDAARDALLAALPDAWAIYVYGSFARKEEWPTSDLDLAVLLPPGESFDDLLGLMGRVSERVGHRDIDLVNLREVGDVLRGEILADGRSLYAASPERLLAWEAAAMSSHAAHFEPIRAILEDFRKTGIGYANS